ncbi:hypothetical protein KOR34_11550 [Posidoniimonas corsicana]|uniref:Uncharacterized protein n=1 Tax=Posidoniimonas corsicana TaxID=1938618 RepID=A0A5C5VDI4_9BACT|nr:hypothetical protein [Posidoniimonas corsicana]TWT36251.1 hypothetical protein KOR34_11550 [Posidoniimonas corsicana]
MNLNARRSVLTVTLCLCAAGGAARVARAQAAPDTPSCVLLTNGNVMTGRVSRSGGRLLIQGEGSQVWLEESAVVHVAADLEEVYRWKRSQQTRPDIDHHLRLATWCMKQRLFPQASRELLEARVMDPADRRVAALQRQLFEQSRPRRKDYAVQQAAYEAPAGVVSATVEPPAPAMTPDELEQLPAGVLEQFTRRIQPILVNNCTAGGCHQGLGPEQFHLDRSILHGAGDYRTTQANLAATLRYVDRVDPAKSELLLAAQQPHAGRSTAAFTGRHAALEAHLVAWVNAACRPPEEASQPASPQAASGGVFDLVKAQHERDRFVQSVEERVAKQGQRDEFDPAVFNRRYGPQREADGQ